jgi:alanine racemase
LQGFVSTWYLIADIRDEAKQLNLSMSKLDSHFECIINEMQASTAAQLELAKQMNAAMKAKLALAAAAIAVLVFRARK